MTAQALPHAPAITPEEEFRQTWIRPAPFMDRARRAYVRRVVREYQHGGMQRQIETFNRWWQARNREEEA